MISKKEIDLYAGIYKYKAITEKYLGYIDFDWEYSAIYYNADCTLAVPFDLFDKVITGLLLIDDCLSIEQIGEILGMNLVSNVEELQYKDDAEYDILRTGLDNLVEFNMIEVGDSSYSSCKLTDKGRTFAKKGFKFKVEENKRFRLFFDHTTNNHTLAQQELEKFKGTVIKCKPDLNFLDEALLQNIVESQLPELHNPDIGNTFINPKIDWNKSNTYSLKIAIALLFDVVNQQTRLVAYDFKLRNINPYFTNYINDNKLEFIDSFITQINDYVPISFNKSYIQELGKAKERIDKLISSDPQDALFIFQSANTSLEFVDLEYFWLHIGDFIAKDTKEIYLSIPEVNEVMLTRIKETVESRYAASLIILIQLSKDESINEAIYDLYHLSKRIDNNLFVAVCTEIERFDCSIKYSDKVISLEEVYYNYQNNEVQLKKRFYKRKTVSLSDFPTVYFDVAKSLAKNYLDIIRDEVSTILEIDIEENLINKSYILSQLELGAKANFFVDKNIDLEANQKFKDIIRLINKNVDILKQKHQQSISLKLGEISDKIKVANYDKVEDVAVLESEIAALEQEYFDSYSTIFKVSRNLKAQIANEIKRIKDEVLSKTYIIDTNAFIKDPDIISKIDSKHYVALSLSVLEELDKLKTLADTKVNASKAIININSVLRSSPQIKNPRVRKAKANLTLLPEELQKKTADNMLLSLGLVYHKKNPVIVTLDRNFQSKALMLNIPLITVNELLGIKEPDNHTRIPIGTEQSNLTRPKKLAEPFKHKKLEREKKLSKEQNIYLKLFNSIGPDKDGLVLIRDFINLVQKNDPKFDFKKLGFSNVFEFIFSIRIFKISKSKFIKLR